MQTAIDSGVQGIALTLAKPDAVAPAVKAALDKNIPVVAFNWGFDDFKAMGIQEYFGYGESSPASPRANVFRRTAPRRSSA